MNKWLAVFEGGTQTDSNGNTRDWTEDDLDRIVSNYEQRKDDAPVVIGHPKSDDPAWGWIDKLKRVGKRLYARFKQVDEKFAEMVNAGRFKYRSIAITPDFRLRHVGFLGAAAPAVAGLGETKFEDGQEFALYDQEYSLDGWIINSIGRLFRGIREWIIEEKGKEAADQIIPDYSIAGVESYESEPEEKPLPRFEKVEKTDEVEMEDMISKEAHEAEVNKFTAQVADLQNQLAEFKRKEEAAKTAERDRQIAQFCDGLKKDGAELTPKSRLMIAEFMQSIAEVQEFEFSEGDGKKKEIPLQKFQALVGGGIEFIHTGEEATKDRVKTVAGNAGEKLADLAKSKQSDNPGMSFSRAFSLVQKENTELAEAYKSEIRQ